MNWKDEEGTGRGLLQGTLPEFTRRDWGKQCRTSVGITDLRTEIWTVKNNVNMWTGLNWHGIGTSGGLLWTR